jgi:hypothetical protein
MGGGESETAEKGQCCLSFKSKRTYTSDAIAVKSKPAIATSDSEDICSPRDLQCSGSNCMLPWFLHTGRWQAKASSWLTKATSRSYDINLGLVSVHCSLIFVITLVESDIDPMVSQQTVLVPPFQAVIDPDLSHPAISSRFQSRSAICARP